MDRHPLLRGTGRPGQLFHQSGGPFGRGGLRTCGALPLAGDLGGLQILEVAADHPVELLGGLHVAVDLGAHELDRVDPHQLDLEEVAGLVEHEVVPEALDDLPEEFLLLVVQALVRPDAVGHGVQIGRVGTGVLGWLGDALRAVPSVEVLLIYLVQGQSFSNECVQMMSKSFPTSGLGAGNGFRGEGLGWVTNRGYSTNTS